MNKSVTVDPPTLGGEFPFRALRVQFGISQRELARRAEVGECTIRRLERGKTIGLPMLRRLAPHLELTFGQALAIMVPLDEGEGRYAFESTPARTTARNSARGDR